MEENETSHDSALLQYFDQNQLSEFYKACKNIIAAGSGYGEVTVIFRASKPVEIDGRFSVKLKH